MSFFMMPNNSFPNVSYPRYETQQYPSYYVNLPTSQHVAPRRENAPFKVYVFERKFDRKTPLRSASNILRFEVDSNYRSFDKVLNEHSIDVKSCNLYYVDDENDLVALMNERDFYFMTKLMKGQLTKIICEKKIEIPQKPTIRVCRIPQQASFVRQVPELGSKYEKKETVLDRAMRASFPLEKPEQFFPKVSTPPQPSQPRKESPVRRIEIDLLDLFGIPKQSEQKTEKEEPREEKKDAQSFREFLVKRLKERYPAEEKKDQAEENHQTVFSKSEESQVDSTVEDRKSNEEVTPVQVDQQQVSEQSNSVEQPTKEEVNSPTSQSLEYQDPIIESIVDEEDDDENTIKTTIPHKYQKELKHLNDMGFTNHILNVTLLNKYNGDLERTISDIIHQ